MKAEFFAKNRQMLGESVHGGLVVLRAYSKMQRSTTEAFKFEQESNFWYLTGIDEPDWWLIYDGTRNKTWLVRPEIDKVLATFYGELGSEEAVKISGAHEVVSKDDALSLLRQLKRSHNLVYTIQQPKDIEKHGFIVNPALTKMHELLDRNFESVRDCRKELAKQRAIKQPEEITEIKKAIAITCKAFKRVHDNLSNYSYEYEIEADITHEFRRSGANGHAYDPIVATGKNACTLHYGKNSAKLKKGSAVLIDAGAKIGGYAADITRTYSFGEPSKRVREVHGAVDEVRASIIRQLSPTLSLQNLQHIVEKEMTEKIVALGLADSETALTKLPCYFPHAIGHGLGIDVHDSLAHQTIQPGMVITIEPGIYIPKENIGVRIEDDILITKKGALNLSAKLPPDLL